MADNMAQDYADTIAQGFRGTQDFDPWEYVSEALDLERTYNMSGQLTGVSLLVTFGGPNCYADFDGHGVTVRAYWGGDRGESYVLCPDFSEGVLECVESFAPSC